MTIQLSWQVTVTTAGTEVAFAGGGRQGLYQLKADPANTGYIYVGNNGSNVVSSTTGMSLAAGDVALIVLSNTTLYVDSSVNGEKLHVLLVQELADTDA